MRTKSILSIALMASVVFATAIPAQEMIRGGIRGAMIGGLIGGKKGAKAGARLGAAVGLVKKIDRKQREDELRREALLRRQYLSGPSYHPDERVDFNRNYNNINIGLPNGAADDSPQSLSDREWDDRAAGDIAMIEQRYGPEAAISLKQRIADIQRNRN